MEARFVESKGYKKDAAYYMFTSKISDYFISVLKEGTRLKVCLTPSMHTNSEYFDAIVVQPSFLPYSHKVFLVERPYQSKNPKDPGYEEFIKLEANSLSAEEHTTSASAPDLQEKISALHPRKVLLILSNSSKVPKRNINALGRIMANEAGQHTKLKKILLAQDLEVRTGETQNIYRNIAKQPERAEFPDETTDIQMSMLDYCKAVPHNLGIVTGGAGTAKTTNTLGFLVPLLRNEQNAAKVLEHGDYQPERTFHQLIYTAETNATCKGAVEHL